MLTPYSDNVGGLSVIVEYDSNPDLTELVRRVRDAKILDRLQVIRAVTLIALLKNSCS